MTTSMNAKEIKALRKKLDMTGNELAALLGVTGNTVRRWECGARQAKGPAVALLRRMAKELRPVTA